MFAKWMRIILFNACILVTVLKAIAQEIPESLNQVHQDSIVDFKKDSSLSHIQVDTAIKKLRTGQPRLVDISFNRFFPWGSSYAIDTALGGQQKFYGLFSPDFNYRPLGEFGKPILPLGMDRIEKDPGPRWGFDKHRAYFLHFLPQDLFLKSFSITQLQYIQGPRSIQHFQIFHHQPIVPGLSAFAGYHILNSPGAYVNDSTRLDQILAGLQFQTKDKKYFAIFRFNNSRVFQNHHGGMIDTMFYNVFNKIEGVAEVRRKKAKSIQKEPLMELYHHWALGSKSLMRIKDSVDVYRVNPVVLIYHKAGWEKFKRRYRDFDTSTQYYRLPYGLDSIEHSWSHRKIFNEIGIQLTGRKPGNVFKPEYFPFAIKVFGRYDMDELKNDWDASGYNHFSFGLNAASIPGLLVPGRLSLSVIKILSGAYSREGKYLLEYQGAVIHALDLSFRIKYTDLYPDRIMETAENAVLSRRNNFKRTGRLNIALGLQSRQLGIGITPAIHSLNGWIDQFSPNDLVQREESLTVGSIGFSSQHRVWKLHLNTDIHYQFHNDPVLTLPEFIVNGSLYFQNELFESGVPTQIGVDLFYMSTYNAPFYEALSDEFYINGFYSVPTLPVVDLFINIRLERAWMFFKYAYINRSFMKPQGNFVTPYHPMPRGGFFFGVNWYLFL